MRKLLIYSILISLFSCVNENDTSNAPVKDKEQLQEAQTAYESVSGLKGEGTETQIELNGKSYRVLEYDDYYLYGGDILIDKNRVTNGGGKSPGKENLSFVENGFGRKWPLNDSTCLYEVYYVIDPSLPKKERIRDAIEEWEDKTALSFIERTNQDNYIFFTSGDGCSASNVGMASGRLTIKLSPTTCSTGNTIHEIGHAVGLYHEHTRKDRDNYIYVFYENIKPDSRHNFTEHSPTAEDKGPFDFNSIMMYPSGAFSSNGSPTMLTKDREEFDVQRDGLSPGDISGIDYLYPPNPVSCQ